MSATGFFSRSCFTSLRWLLLALAGATSVPLLSAQSDPATVGQWSSVQTWPTRAVSAHLLPTGKVLFVSYYVESKSPQIWDPETNAISAGGTTSYDLFCTGHSYLPDGRILFTGGHKGDYIGWPYASIYNPFTNTFSAAPNMNAGRWYPTNTTLPNGDILTISGDIDSQTNVDTLPQIYQTATGTWKDLNTALLALPLYPRMFLAPNGKVFLAGPDRVTRYLDTTGTGAWSSVATTNFNIARTYGSAVMYEPGKIMIVGGGGPPTNTAETIDLNSATPVWKKTGNMTYVRRQHNATLLADGTVLITGGSSGSGFDDSNLPVYNAEIWNAATGTFSSMAPEAVYRGYHSTALLLPDGRVLTAGGNVGGHNAETYSPPYLFKGARPAISSVPATFGFGQSIFLSTPDAANVGQVTFIRLGSVTHSFDMDQRFISLSFTAAPGGLNINTPTNPNIAPPGNYMLFIVSAAGVPSVAKIVQIGTNLSPPPVGSIMGQVTDSATGPLSGATVSFNGGTTTTDASGNYTLANVPTGSVQLTASLTGYQNLTQSVAVTADTKATANFALVAGTSSGTGSVSGHVTSSSGASLADAQVSFDGGSATTDAAGSYNLPTVPDGNIHITASLNGYQSSARIVAVTQGAQSTANFVLTPNAPPPPSTGTISGMVTKLSNGQVIAGTIKYGAATATSGSTGSYNFTAVPPGTYTVTASANGYLPRSLSTAVTAGANSTLNFQLATGGKIRGTVTSTTGAAVSSTTVKLSGGTISTTVTLTTDTSGNYLSNWIPVGSYTITVSKTGRASQSKSGSVTSGATTTVNFTSF
ncbi:MAG: Kelch domain protein [Acidobacteriales bacterium]|nr:Kelch domain protein [Terriglobales bacterium]